MSRALDCAIEGYSRSGSLVTCARLRDTRLFQVWFPCHDSTRPTKNRRRHPISVIELAPQPRERKRERERETANRSGLPCVGPALGPGRPVRGLHRVCRMLLPHPLSGLDAPRILTHPHRPAGCSISAGRLSSGRPAQFRPAGSVPAGQFRPAGCVVPIGRFFNSEIPCIEQHQMFNALILFCSINLAAVCGRLGF